MKKSTPVQFLIRILVYCLGLLLLAFGVAGGMAAKLYLDRVNGVNQPPVRPRILNNPPSDVAGSENFFGEEERSEK